MRNDDLIYDWLDLIAESKSVSRRNLFKEEKIRDFVTKRDLPTVTKLGIADADFQSGNGDSIIIGNNYASNIINVSLANGEQVQFHKDYAKKLQDAFSAACEETKKIGKPYCPSTNGGGGFVPRRMRNDSEYNKPESQRVISNHSWGIAIDIEPSKNPRGSRNGDIRRHPEFIQTMKNNGFIWGGDWTGNSVDDMHFEVNFGNVNVDQSSMSTTQAGVSSEFSSYGGGDGGEYTASGFFDRLRLGESINNDEKIFKIIDKTSKKIYSKHKKYFNSLLKHLKKELKINKPVKIILEEDKENAKKVLGRTGGYINHEIKIHIFCSGRHIKDIMRSLSHEMVHHHQNLRGEFKKHEPTSDGYAQTNKHLRKMEEEAYLKGNILFRDWEDNYKYRGEK
jgi:hypothetical protein